MICTLNTGEKITLNDSEVKAAKKMVARFIENIKTSASQNERPTLYLTTLIVMESTAGDLLSSIDAKKLKAIIETLN